MDNAFQTPLLLRKIHLIWKFKKSEESTVVSNFGSEKSGNHEKFVKVRVVENVLLENGQTTMLELGFVPLVGGGDLEIVGVEYSLKAQFPQSEATDYTIHGRQCFSVRGPRLSANKEHKTSVVYGPDHRLSFQVRVTLKQGFFFLC